MMKFLKLGKGPVGVGCGHLYAMPVKDFKVGETTYTQMAEIGYIAEDGATFRRTGESTPITSASDGQIATFVSGYETEFETSTIALTKENMTLYTSGSEVVDNEDGTYTIYGCEDDAPANLALCFRGENNGIKFELYMPIVFLSCNKDFKIDMKNGSNRTFSVALNFSTELFYKIFSLFGAAGEKEISDIEQVNTVNCIFAELVNYPVEWVLENVSFENQLKLIESVFQSLNGLFEKEFLQIPDIKPEKEKPNSKNKEAKKRYDKQRKIERLEKQVRKKDGVYLMNDIAVVLVKTNNTYSEIMNMPILVFRDLVRTITFNELMSDTDYKLAYFEDRASKLQKDLNNGSKETITKPSAPKKTGANLMDLLIEY